MDKYLDSAESQAFVAGRSWRGNRLRLLPSSGFVMFRVVRPADQRKAVDRLPCINSPGVL